MTTMMRKKPNYKRGDIVLVRFPDSNLLSTTARPGVIVQADNLQMGLPQVIMAMITDNMFRASHPSRVPVLLATPGGQQSGLIM